MKIGKMDVFEREYLGKFRELASRFGEFVDYERDRAARDIGLHLSRKKEDGSEQLTSTLCWFQMKGITKARMSKRDFDQKEAIDIRLDVQHLQFWYRQPMPTYLVVYVEAANEFLVTDIQKYVHSRWGESIFTLKAKSAVVVVSKSSVLDEQAFKLIVRHGDISEWIRVLRVPPEDAEVCARDGSLIYNLAGARERGHTIAVSIRDWISKTRTEVDFYESTDESQEKWAVVHQHWQLFLPASAVEATFPYIAFSADDDDDSSAEWEYDEETAECATLKLSNGDVVYPMEAGLEACDYSLRASLNERGEALFVSLQRMLDAKLLSVEQRGSFISVAPWHARDV